MTVNDHGEPRRRKSEPAKPDSKIRFWQASCLSIFLGHGAI
ncbi:hypothetical protein PCL1606_42860 [Pseudomonas chlororaphis]|uniref:Uncharacterized protein n=1 Tax=Pseudomonas chlororaphis TaxID=587753 RepID=A0A0D5Y316_9PSED|nr:hypothetical protein PCL1606_42860 [Pseudomonas chlororaphis]